MKTLTLQIDDSLYDALLILLKQMPESKLRITDNSQPSKQSQNPAKAILESGFVGCGEAEPNLSVNYKREFARIMDEKDAHC